MQLHQAINNVFIQLANSLEQLTPEQYNKPIHTLFNASIGQHVRHIVEFFICLNQGYETGVVNYENRKRDHLVETDKAFAASLLVDIYTGLEKADKPLILEASYDEHSDETIRVQTNYYREIVYNLEHVVHHMALIRVGITEVSDIVLPEGFGIASSTIKYRSACAQ